MRTFIKTLIATSAGTMLTAGAHAFDATATVSNAITLTETTPMSLGSLFIKKGLDAVNTGNGVGAVLTLDQDAGSASTTTPGSDADGADTASNIVSLGGAQAGVLEVTGAQAFGSLTVTHGALTDLVHSGGNPAVPVIDFTSLLTTPANAGTLTLDAAGAGQILVGGTFTAAVAATAGTAYQDGVYTGTYALTVSY